MASTALQLWLLLWLADARWYHAPGIVYRHTIGLPMCMVQHTFEPVTGTLVLVALALGHIVVHAWVCPCCFAYTMHNRHYFAIRDARHDASIWLWQHAVHYNSVFTKRVAKPFERRYVTAVRRYKHLHALTSAWVIVWCCDLNHRPMLCLAVTAVLSFAVWMYITRDILVTSAATVITPLAVWAVACIDVVFSKLVAAKDAAVFKITGRRKAKRRVRTAQREWIMVIGPVIARSSQRG